MGSAYALYAKPEVTPDPLKDPSFDPQYGFPGARKPRVMIATEDEMRAAKIPVEDRDYCAHVLLKYQGCRADVYPFVYKCAHEKHEYLTCEYEDYVLRMKEYERERRLMERKHNKEKRSH